MQDVAIWVALRLVRWAVAALLTVTTPMLSTFSFAGETIVRTETGDKLLYSESYALIISEAHYRSWPRLDSTISQGRELRDALVGLGFERANITLREDLGSGDLLGAIHQFLNERSHQQPRVRLLIYFSGHGMTQTYGTSEVGYLVPVDAPDVGDPSFFSKAVLLTEIRVALESTVMALHTLVLFDSCFSGSVFESRGPERLTPLRFSALMERRIQIITAGGKDERAPAQSQFLPALIDGARGKADLDHDGIVTGDELAVYLRSRVTQTTPQAGFVGRDTRGEFVFVPTGGSIAQVTESAPSPAPRVPSRADMPTRGAGNDVELIASCGRQWPAEPDLKRSVLDRISFANAQPVVARIVGGLEDDVSEGSGTGVRLFGRYTICSKASVQECPPPQPDCAHYCVVNVGGSLAANRALAADRLRESVAVTVKTIASVSKGPVEGSVCGS